jgi:hypothetical protein
MILTGENRRTRRKPGPSETSLITNLTWTKLETRPGLRGQRPADTQRYTSTHSLTRC